MGVLNVVNKDQSFESLRKHLGHRMAVVREGDEVRLECKRCDVAIVTQRDGDNLHKEQELQRHIKHHVVCVWYGEKSNPVNVAVECEHCGEVLLDFDAE